MSFFEKYFKIKNIMKKTTKITNEVNGLKNKSYNNLLKIIQYLMLIQKNL